MLSGVIMYKVMPTRPFSDVRVDLLSVFEQLRTTPILLTHRGHSAAMLVNLRAWNYLIEVYEQAKAAGLLDIDAETITDWVDLPEPTTTNGAGYVAETNRA
jgi:PHD/YefM family antitoxin component YafN of YafNO toxin-antitoxin module